MCFLNVLVIMGVLLNLVGAIVVVLVIFVKKVRHGSIWLISVFLIATFGFFVRHEVVTIPFHTFNKEVCNLHPEIENIELSRVNQGQILRLYIHMNYKTDEIEDETMERIFIDMMKKVNEEPMSDYLKRRANHSSNWLIIQIYFFVSRGQFESNQYNRSEWFTEENKKVQSWRNTRTHKVYHYSDYVK